MNQAGTRFTKRIFLINRDFQIRYAKIAFMVGLISTVLTIVLILYPLHHFGVIRFPGFLPAPFMVAIILASLFNFILVVGGSILMTHRVAGPMFSLVRTMRVIQAGIWTGRLKVRDTDDMKFVVRNFNELLDYLEATAKRDREDVDGALTSLAEGDVESARVRLGELREHLVERVGGKGTEEQSA